MTFRWPLAAVLGLLPVGVIAALALHMHATAPARTAGAGGGSAVAAHSPQLSMDVRAFDGATASIAATVTAGPCRHELATHPAADERVATASDRLAAAFQTSSTPAELEGPLREWQQAMRATVSHDRLGSSSLAVGERKLAVCRPQA